MNIAAVSAAYDNIRLIRRKIQIEQQLVEDNECGARRDEAMMRGAHLSEDLIRALNDFAALGYEDRIVQMIKTQLNKPSGD